MLDEKNWIAKKLRPHIGHKISCVYYGDADNPADVCIECEDCGEVLVSAEDYNAETQRNGLNECLDYDY